MSFVGDIIGDVFGGITGASQAADAAQEASRTQATASLAGMAEQRVQFDKLVELMAPYVTAGRGALVGQQALIGLQGPEAERAAIERIQGGETFQALANQGEEALLQRASATGGLRGGNIQAALAQFRPQLLSSLIEQQYGRLGNLSTLGQAASAGQAASGTQLGQSISGLLGQQGAATAGGQLAQGGVAGSTFGTLASLAAAAQGAGLFGGNTSPSLMGGTGQTVGGGGTGFKFTKF